jgi:hypothetical protein
MWGWVVAFVFLGYLLPHFLVAALPTQDLKKKARAAQRACSCVHTSLTPPQYNASWALVTGASSGAADRELSSSGRTHPARARTLRAQVSGSRWRRSWRCRG